MHPQADALTPNPVQPHKGFIYFCEETLRYNEGLRAWAFFVPYLLGAVLLEPGLDAKTDDHSIFASWLLLLVYLLLFPPVWRAVLIRVGLWRRKTKPTLQGEAAKILT